LNTERVEESNAFQTNNPRLPRHSISSAPTPNRKNPTETITKESDKKGEKEVASREEKKRK
jgi:hypothetical protein